MLGLLFIIFSIGCLSEEKTPNEKQENISTNNKIVEDFRPIWERACQYTLELTQLMPEEFYQFKPTGEVRSFQEQLIHTTQNIYWLTSTYIAQENNPYDVEDKTLSKVETIQLLEDVFKYVNESLDKVDDTKLTETISLFDSVPVPRKRALTLMRDHMTHHRAQCIIYLRMKGLEPPSYVGW